MPLILDGKRKEVIKKRARERAGEATFFQEKSSNSSTRKFLMPCPLAKEV